MKRFFLLLIVLSVSLLLKAQTADKQWGFGLGAGAYGNFDKSGVGLMPEFHLSKYLSPTFDLMLQQSLAFFNSGVRSDMDAANTLLNLRFKFYNGKMITEDSPIRPYLYAGPGYLFDNRTSGLNFNLGLGSKFAVSPTTSLFLEGGYIDGITYKAPDGGNRKEDMWKIVGGIVFTFGKAKDSDRDGVPDRVDKCPDTPFGVTVDKNGCPVDSDGDGIPDYLDDCPHEAGLSSLGGCPDTDGDGIADKYDECPEEPGTKELKGCPDTDGDGVIDKNDLCPDTPSGVIVDENGCPVDSDGDGIPDYLDDCPHEAGPKENNGCPIEEAEKQKSIVLDIKINPVYFSIDQSYLTDYSKDKLDKLITLLNENPDYKINLSGFTDNIGSKEYNQLLSERRVKSVIGYLTSNGLDQSRIYETKAFGKESPAADNASEEGRRLNRRVEFEVFELK